MILSVKARRKAAFILLLLFMVFCISSYKLEADAFVIAVPAAIALAVGVGILITAGVVFATTGDAKAAGQAFVDHFSNEINTLVAEGKIVKVLATQAYNYVAHIDATQWKIFKLWVDANFNVGPQTVGSTEANPVLMNTNYPMSNSGSYVYLTNTASFVYLHYKVQDGQLWSYQYFKSNNTLREATMLTAVTGPIFFNNNGAGLMNFHYENNTFVYTLATNADATMRYCPGVSTNTGVTGTAGQVDNPEWDWNNEKTGEKDIPVPLITTAPGDIPDVVATPATGTVGLTVPSTAVEQMVGETAADVAEKEVTGTVVDDVPATTIAGDIAIGSETVDTNKLKMPNVTDKFPFCIPFDLIHLVQVFSANGAPPKWTIPIDFKVVNYKQDIVIDFSQFNSVANVVRWGETIIFVLGLVLITRKVIKG